MAVIRSRPVAGQAVRLANPAVDRSLRAWEARVEEAETAAYQRARQEVEAELMARVREAEAQAQAAQESVDERMQALETAHQQQWGDLLHSLAQVHDELSTLRSATVLSAEGEVLRLAIAMAARILQRDISAEDHSWLADILTPALTDLPARHGISIRLHPDDAAEAQAQLEQALQRLSEPPSMPRIEADAVLARGSCRIECSGTVIDVSIPGAWARVAEHLLQEAPVQHMQHLIEPAAGDAAAASGNDGVSDADQGGSGEAPVRGPQEPGPVSEDPQPDQDSGGPS